MDSPFDDSRTQYSVADVNKNSEVDAKLDAAGTDWQSVVLGKADAARMHQCALDFQRRRDAEKIADSRRRAAELGDARRDGRIRQAEFDLRARLGLSEDSFIDEDGVDHTREYGHGMAIIYADEELKADSAAVFIENRIAVRDQAGVRSTDGYSWHGGIVAGQKQEAFHVEGLKSALHPILLFFASKLNRASSPYFRAGQIPRLSKLSSGNSKSVLEPQEKKILALDMTYCNFNAEMRGLIRIDIDRDFPSIVALVNEIETAGCPLPNLVVCHNIGGRLVRPHLYFILRDSVCWTSKGRSRPQALFKAVERSLTEQLAPLGADPHATNGLRGKNPLSEHWDTSIVIDEPYTLGGDMGSPQNLSARLSLDSDIRERGRGLEDVGSGSNRVFKTALTTASRMIGIFHPASRINQDRRQSLGAADEGATTAAFEEAVYARCKAIIGPDVDARFVEQCCERATLHIWRTFNPDLSRLQKPRREGIMKGTEELSVARTRAERMRAGGRFGANVRVNKTVERMARVADEMGFPAAHPTAADVERLIDACGVSRATYFRHARELETARLMLRSYNEAPKLASATGALSQSHSGLVKKADGEEGKEQSHMERNHHQDNIDQESHKHEGIQTVNQISCGDIIMTIPAMARSCIVEFVIRSLDSGLKGATTDQYEIIRKRVSLMMLDSRRFNLTRNGYSVYAIPLIPGSEDEEAAA